MAFSAIQRLGIGLAPLGYEVRTLLAYDRWTDATRGMALANRLSEQLGDQFQISIDILKFNLLSHAWVRQSAIETAARASMIFVAASGRTDLPPHVAAWMKGWPPRKYGDPCALVAVLDEEPLPGTQTLRAYFSRIAADSCMRFFCSPVSPNLRHPTQISRMRDTTIQEWGLNEC